MKLSTLILPRGPLVALMLIIVPTLTARAQDSRIQMGTLDHLAAKASQTVDVNIDERLMQLASKIFSDRDSDEKEIKALISGLKGIYVKSFEFDNDGQYADADVESIRSQLRGAAWSRLVNVTSKRDGNIEVYVMLSGTEAGGLTVISTDARELTVVNIVGPIDLEKLTRLEGKFGVPDLGIEQPKPKTKNDDN